MGSVGGGSGGGTTIDTGSFATTGSNTFIGNQTITGSVNITGSLTVNNLNVDAYQGYTNYNSTVNLLDTASVQYIDITGKNYIKLTYPTSSTGFNPVYTIALTGSMPSGSILPKIMLDAYQFTSSNSQYQAPINLTSSVQWPFVLYFNEAPVALQMVSSAGGMRRQSLALDNTFGNKVIYNSAYEYYTKNMTLAPTVFVSGAAALLYQFESGSNLWNNALYTGTGSIYNPADTGSVKNLVNNTTASWSNTGIVLESLPTPAIYKKCGYRSSYTNNGFLSASANTYTFTSASGVYFGASFMPSLFESGSISQSAYVIARAENDLFKFSMVSASAATGSFAYYMQLDISGSYNTTITSSTEVLSAASVPFIFDSTTTRQWGQEETLGVNFGFIWENDYVVIFNGFLTAIAGYGLAGSQVFNVTGSLPASSTTNVELFGTSAESNKNFVGLSFGAILQTGSSGVAIQTQGIFQGAMVGNRIALPTGL
jgi:hypothetical protein